MSRRFSALGCAICLAVVCVIILFCSGTDAQAEVVAVYDGTDSPTASGWNLWAGSGANEGTSYASTSPSGLDAWRIEGEHPGVHWFQYPLSTNQLSGGWTASARVGGVSNPRSPTTPSLSCGLCVEVPDDIVWAIDICDDGVYGLGSDGTFSDLIVDIDTSGDHLYQIVYNPAESTSSASLVIDGSLITSMLTPKTDNTTGHGPAVLFGDLSISGAGSADWSFVEVNTTVPEPATLGLLALGGLAMLHRRKV